MEMMKTAMVVLLRVTLLAWPFYTTDWLVKDQYEALSLQQKYSQRENVDKTGGGMVR